MESLGVGRLELRALFERFDRLVELSLPVVIGRELQVDRRVLRLHVPGVLVGLLGFRIGAGILVEARELEIVAGVAWIHLNELLDHRFCLRRVVEFVGAVHLGEELEAAARQQLVLVVRLRVELLEPRLVILHGLLKQRIVVGLALSARPILLLVTVREVEIRVSESRVGFNRVVILLGRLAVVLPGVCLVCRFGRATRLDDAEL